LGQPENPWSAYRRKRNICIVLFILTPFVPVPISGYLEKYTFDGFVSIIITIWGVLLIYFFNSLSNFRCPRCGKPFIYNGKRGIESRINGFTRKCLNCKLPKWSLPDDSNME
jgi:predicted RNA-binding Zn-ribbon protein involved in translation (DUF1610 family)